MCAIAGLLQPPDEAVDGRLLAAMMQAQVHRGPDGEGYVLLSSQSPDKAHVAGRTLRDLSYPQGRYSIGLAHRRLAVIDVSDAGHQPMASADRRDWITYNGEIYNFVEVREELCRLGHEFRSASDTEVLLAAYRQWGLGCLDKLNGMFAFALWDGVGRRLVCARDRLGEKPFYYSWERGRLAFASELKGLLPALTARTVNQRLAYAYLDGGRLDFSRDTFLEQVQQLEPAHYLILDNGQLAQGRYWQLAGKRTERSAGGEAMREQFRELLTDAVRLRLRSDVAVGSCLSGGLDSSAVVCLKQEILGRPKQKTFSACFAEGRFDERRFIEEVVRARGLDTHYTIPDPKELSVVLDRLVWQQDEPFGSTSIFAQWTVMRLVSESGVKVVLDGQGADELLGGYHGFFGAFFADLLRAGRWAQALRQWLAYRRLHGRLPPQALANFGRALLPASSVQRMRDLVARNHLWMNGDFARRWRCPEPPDIAASSAVTALQHRLLTRHGLRALLRAEDRNSMAFGVEARLPFLDHRLVEWAYGLDKAWMLRDGWTKILLRESLGGILPPVIQWRSDKMGFATPEDEWFRGELGLVLGDCLADQRTKTRGYLDIGGASQVWQSHRHSRAALGPTLWRWLNLELWCRRFVDHRLCDVS
jgi:asparagine synthase (glutamine-hydrolysing)